MSFSEKRFREKGATGITVLSLILNLPKEEENKPPHENEKNKQDHEKHPCFPTLITRKTNGEAKSS